MDELTLLRSTRDDRREPSSDALASGRAALMKKIGSDRRAALAGSRLSLTPPKNALRRRQNVAWAGFSVLGAASLTFALVATNVLGLGGWTGGADPAAANVLHTAAAATVRFSDPILNPGEYLFVLTDGAAVVTGTLDADAERIRQQGGDIQDSDAVSALETQRQELYVPADHSDDWVWIQCTSRPLQTFGPRSEKFADELAASTREYDSDTIREFPGGITPGGQNFGGYRDGVETRVDYDSLPTDPTQLLSKIYELNGNAGQSREGEALEWITSALNQGTAPAEFRAALYGAAAEIPGVEITESSATLNGTTGVALGRVETADNTRHDIIIDPATGRFIGERHITLDGFADVPAGTAMYWTTVTTTVVTTAPTDVASCGASR